DTTKAELASNIETAKTELNTKIGDTTQLTTTDKTNLVGALNEVKTSVDSIETTAEKTSYNNTTSNLTATNVQGAIDEVVAKIERFNNENIKIQNDMLPI
ncbi:phage tail protein, partial [Clostridioides sp. ZZV15-6598]|nr:phage tail protein [Clostridioides sp. ZZV15-6598]